MPMPHNPGAGRRLGRPCLAVILAFLLSPLFSSPAASAEESENWKLMLQRNYEELQYQIEYVDGVSQTLPGMVKQTRQDLASLRKKLDELMVLGRVSGGNPMELRAVLAGLDILQARVEAVTQPFQKADTDLKRFQERLAELETEFAQQAADGPSQEINKALGDFLGDLRKLKNKLGRVKTVLDQGLNPTRDLKTGIGKSSQAVTERIPRAWKDYYLAAGKSLLSLGAWQEAAQRITELPRYVATFANLFDSGEGRAKELLLRVFGLALVLLLAATVALKRLEHRFGGFRISKPLGCMAWIGSGIAVLWATSGASYVLVRAETGAVAEILLARGVLGLSWFLRLLQTGGIMRARPTVAAPVATAPEPQPSGDAAVETADDMGPEPDLEPDFESGEPDPEPAAEQKTPGAPKRNPAAHAWWMFSLGVLLQMPWLPEVFRGAVWVVALVAAGWLVRRAAARRAAAGRATDAVSRLALAGGWLYPLLVLPALFGWVNLTMLAAEGWFMALVTFQAGLALYALVGRLIARPSADLASEAVKSLIGGLALPFTVIAMTGGFLFWLSMAMGGRSVFFSVVSSDMGGEGFSMDLGRLAVIFVGFYLARAATRLADRLIAELPARRPDLERGVLNLLETISTYVIWGVYVLVSLHLAGASFTSLAVVAGGLSVGIGFGMQNIINNFISGLILLFGRSVQAGDVLQIGETWGSVQRVNIRNTVVQTFDNATLFVPNSDLIAQKIINWSHKDRRVRRSLEVGVAYGSDTSLVHSLLIEAARSHPNVLADPKPVAYFTAFGDSALNFRLAFWINDLDNASRTNSEVHMAVDRIFRENGVDIPFPQRDVTLRTAAGGPSPQSAQDDDGDQP